MLTSDYLFTVDNDTLPEQLVYSVITSPTNGYLAFANKTKEKLLNFTQAMVNQGKVAFVHAGIIINSNLPLENNFFCFSQDNCIIPCLKKNLLLLLCRHLLESVH